MKNLEQTLAGLPPDAWIVGQVIVLDWYDGPRRGIARLAEPPCEFVFELLTERFNADGLDDRLFLLSQLPDGSVAKSLDVVRPLGQPLNPFWVPVWKFENESQKLQAEQRLEQILQRRKTPGLIVYSRDMATFLGCWHAPQNADPASDWFSALGIP